MYGCSNDVVFFEVGVVVKFILADYFIPKYVG